jgi:hypothetical protein
VGWGKAWGSSDTLVEAAYTMMTKVEHAWRTTRVSTHISPWALGTLKSPASIIFAAVQVMTIADDCRRRRVGLTKGAASAEAGS